MPETCSSFACVEPLIVTPSVIGFASPLQAHSSSVPVPSSGNFPARQSVLSMPFGQLTSGVVIVASVRFAGDSSRTLKVIVRFSADWVDAPFQPMMYFCVPIARIGAAAYPPSGTRKSICTFALSRFDLKCPSLLLCHQSGCVPSKRICPPVLLLPIRS